MEALDEAIAEREAKELGVLGAARAADVAHVLSPNSERKHGSEVGCRLWRLAVSGRVVRLKHGSMTYWTLAGREAELDDDVQLAPYAELDLDRGDWAVTPRDVLRALATTVAKSDSVEALVSFGAVFKEVQRRREGCTISVAAYRLGLLRKNGLARAEPVDGMRRWGITEIGRRVARRER